MGANKVYWTTKDGRKLDIDTMDEKHVRACLKMVVRQINERKGMAIMDELRRGNRFDVSDPQAMEEDIY